LVEIGLVVLEKKSFKGKSWRRPDGRTTDAAPWQKLPWPSARWAKNKSKVVFFTYFSHHEQIGYDSRYMYTSRRNYQPSPAIIQIPARFLHLARSFGIDLI